MLRRTLDILISYLKVLDIPAVQGVASYQLITVILFNTELNELGSKWVPKVSLECV